MRVKEPQPFDPTKEYKPGERAVYRGMVIIAEIWDKWSRKFSADNPVMFPPRCIRCKIKRDDCPGFNLQCDKFSRTDKKTIYWRFLRVAKGYEATKVFRYSPDGQIAGVEVETIKKVER